jgi:hypothetical protein
LRGWLCKIRRAYTVLRFGAEGFPLSPLIPLNSEPYAIWYACYIAVGVVLYKNSDVQEMEPQCIACSQLHLHSLMYSCFSSMYSAKKTYCTIRWNCAGNSLYSHRCMAYNSGPSKSTHTDSLWRRQSQQSFNTLTPFNFLFFTHYMFWPLQAILRWDIQLVIISVFEGLF